MHKIAKSWSSK